ncbi:hypothetical protein Tco_0706441 [Tanacetum coccineum]|uniref:Uncharacterized protein n=1 Tax=Tanacetum coccineum TaxID=301880 RepID=A0ABQ4Y9E1_9ASTR
MSETNQSNPPAPEKPTEAILQQPYTTPNHDSETHKGEYQQLLQDEEVLRETLEEQAIVEKEWEDRIKKEEVERDDDTYVMRSFQVKPTRILARHRRQNGVCSHGGSTDWIHGIIMQLLYCLLGLSETRRLLLRGDDDTYVVRSFQVEPTRFLARHCRQNGACSHGGSTDLYQAEGINITANSMPPGFIDIFRGYKNFSVIVGKVLKYFVKHGATTTCYIVLNSKVKGVTGKYFANRLNSTPSVS